MNHLRLLRSECFVPDKTASLEARGPHNTASVNVLNNGKLKKSYLLLCRR